MQISGCWSKKSASAVVPAFMKPTIKKLVLTWRGRKVSLSNGREIANTYFDRSFTDRKEKSSLAVSVLVHQGSDLFRYQADQEYQDSGHEQHRTHIGKPALGGIGIHIIGASREEESGRGGQEDFQR